MTDTASLQIKVVAKGVSEANRKLDTLVDRSESADRATSGLTKQIKGMATPLTAATTATAGLVAATVAFVRHSAAQAKEIRNLSRVAKEGFEQFQGYAYATESAGVSSEKLADISKDLQDKLGDFIATGGGEFADFFDNVGSKVGLTAQSLQELSGPDALIAVKKAMDDANVSAAEQVFYLEAIASDASLLTPLLKDNGKALKEKAEEARKLNGILSETDAKKLEDAAEASKRFDTALGGLTRRAAVEFAPAVTGATDAVTDGFVTLTDSIASGQIEAYLDAIAGKFDGFGSDIAGALDDIQTIWDQFLGSPSGGGIAHATSETVDFIIDAFKNMPENIRAAVQLAVVELASLTDYGSAYGKAFGQVLGVELAKIVDKAGIYAKELKDILNPFDGDTFDYKAALASSNKIASDLATSYFEEAERQASVAKQARKDSIVAITEERDAATESFQAQIEQVSSLSEQYEKLKNKTSDESEDGGGIVGLPTTGEKGKKALEETEDFWAKYLTSAEKSLSSFDELAMGAIDSFSSGVGNAFEKMVYDSQSLEDAVKGLAEGMGRSMVNAIGRMAAEWLAYKAVQMVTGKATAASNAVMATSQAQAMSTMAALNAFASTAAIPITGPAMAPAAMAAATAATQPLALQVASLSSAAVAGAYDHGGMIPAGKFGIVGEYGPELISGPTQVTSRRTTADQFNRSEETRGETNTQVINISFNPTIVSRSPGDIINELQSIKKPLARMMQSVINKPI